MKVNRYFLAAMAVAALGACNRDRNTGRESSTTTVTGANVASVDNVSASNRIADARCKRASSCDNVGAGKHYVSSEACSQKLRAETSSNLNDNDCPGGIAQKGLDACLAAIDADTCGNVLDHLERVTACRSSALCLKNKRP